jgi:hypothetical protein
MADVFAEDFRVFTNYVWQECLRLPEPSPLQYDIANYMQSLPRSADGIFRGQVQSMRGAGKTYLAAAFALWNLYRNPDCKILIISSTTKRAREFVTLCRQIMDAGELLHPLKPKLSSQGSPTGKDQIDNAEAFDVGTLTRPAKDPSLTSYGIFSTFTGSHPDIIISDDIETPENSLTNDGREKLHMSAMEYESLINPRGTVLYLGTPQSEESVYLKLERSYPIRRWPCQKPNLRDEKATRNVSPYILNMEEPEGTPTYPERFNKDQLLEKEAIYGPTMFALQMLLDTTLADAERYPLKLSDLIVMDCNTEMAPARVVWGTTNRLQLDTVGIDGDRFYGPGYVDTNFLDYQTAVMFIDPSGGGVDETSYAVVKALNGSLFLLAAGGWQGGHSEAVMKKLAQVAAVHDIKRVTVETNFGDGMFEKLLQPVMARYCGPVQIDSKRSSGQKELRILDTLEPLLAAHRLVVDTKVAKDQILMTQLTRITRDRGSLKHDDRIEAVAGACALLSDLVVLDPEVRAQEQADAQKRQMAASWLAAAKGGSGWNSGRFTFPDRPGPPTRQRSWGTRQRGAWRR